jgi:hypothetical protein
MHDGSAGAAVLGVWATACNPTGTRRRLWRQSELPKARCHHRPRPCPPPNPKPNIPLSSGDPDMDALLTCSPRAAPAGAVSAQTSPVVRRSAAPASRSLPASPVGGVGRPGPGLRWEQGAQAAAGALRRAGAGSPHAATALAVRPCSSSQIVKGRCHNARGASFIPRPGPSSPAPMQRYRNAAEPTTCPRAWASASLPARCAVARPRPRLRRPLRSTHRPVSVGAAAWVGQPATLCATLPSRKAACCCAPSRPPTAAWAAFPHAPVPPSSPPTPPPAAVAATAAKPAAAASAALARRSYGGASASSLTPEGLSLLSPGLADKYACPSSGAPSEPSVPGVAPGSLPSGGHGGQGRPPQRFAPALFQRGAAAS